MYFGNDIFSSSSLSSETQINIFSPHAEEEKSLNERKKSIE